MSRRTDRTVGTQAALTQQLAALVDASLRWLSAAPGRVRAREHRALVQGDTDSERLFALITRETELRGGDVEEGIRAAIGWVADNVPVFAAVRAQLVLTTPTDLWALRYPQTHDLFVLERDADSGGSQEPRVEQSGSVGDAHPLAGADQASLGARGDRADG